jgi:hypothetical protein
MQKESYLSAHTYEALLNLLKEQQFGYAAILLLIENSSINYLDKLLKNKDIPMEIKLAIYYRLIKTYKMDEEKEKMLYTIAIDSFSK